MTISLALLLALVPAEGKAARQPAPAAEKEKKPMEWRGQSGGPREPGHRVIADKRGWEALWRGALGRDAPPLDFKTHAAVAVFAGERPTGGWSIVFEEKPRGKDLLVLYTIRRPKGFTTQAFTAPWTVRAVKRPKGKVLAAEAQEE